MFQGLLIKNKQKHIKAMICHSTVMVTQQQIYLNALTKENQMEGQFKSSGKKIQSKTKSLAQSEVKFTQNLPKPWFYKPKKSKYSQGSAKRYSRSHWNEKENEKYVRFLENHIFLVSGQVKQKRKYHLNRMMSKFIQTRSPSQCRSHHQKMLMSHGSIIEIIKKLTQCELTLQGSEKMALENMSSDISLRENSNKDGQNEIEEVNVDTSGDNSWQCWNIVSGEIDFALESFEQMLAFDFI